MQFPFPKIYFKLPKSFIAERLRRRFFTSEIQTWSSPVMTKSSTYTKTMVVPKAPFLIKKNEGSTLLRLRPFDFKTELNLTCHSRDYCSST